MVNYDIISTMERGGGAGLNKILSDILNVFGCLKPFRMDSFESPF